MHVTSVEVVDSLLIYTIIHSIIWVLRSGERWLAKLVVTERDKVIHLHARDKHKETLRNCTEGDCASLQEVVSVDAISI